MMDLLSTVLQSLRMIDSAFCMLSRSAPWGYQLEAASTQQVVVLQSLDGDAQWRVGAEQPLQLARGDTAVVVGESCQIWSNAPTPPLALLPLKPQELLPSLRPPHAPEGPIRWLERDIETGAAPSQRLLMVTLLLHDTAQSPLLGMLPRQIVLRQGTTTLFPWSDPVLQFVEHEAGQQRPGYEAAARILAHMVITDVIRTYVLVVGADRANWLRGIADPQIGLALGLIHNEAGRGWRLATLADACHMARSTFSRRFTQLVGRSPMDYLCSVRMHQAAERLLAGERVQQVCAAMGYQSEWSFRKAFAAQFGVTPTTYRKAQRR